MKCFPYIALVGLKFSVVGLDKLIPVFFAIIDFGAHGEAPDSGSAYGGLYPTISAA
jgi:hypothetical protein